MTPLGSRVGRLESAWGRAERARMVREMAAAAGLSEAATASVLAMAERWHPLIRRLVASGFRDQGALADLAAESGLPTDALESKYAAIIARGRPDGRLARC